MISDLDDFRSAKLLIYRHGGEAPICAALRADAMLDKGDMRPRSAAAEYRCESGALVHVQGTGRRCGRK